MESEEKGTSVRTAKLNPGLRRSLCFESLNNELKLHLANTEN